MIYWHSLKISELHVKNQRKWLLSANNVAQQMTRQPQSASSIGQSAQQSNGQPAMALAPETHPQWQVGYTRELNCSSTSADAPLASGAADPMIESHLPSGSVMSMSGGASTSNASVSSNGGLSCVYSHSGASGTKDTMAGMSDDSETPISSPDEPSYKLARLEVPSSPSASFKRELTDMNGSF